GAPAVPESVSWWKEEIRPDIIRGNACFVTVGEKLNVAKEALRGIQGGFGELIEDLGLDQVKAECLMRIAQHPLLAVMLKYSVTSRKLPLGWTVLAELARIPPDILKVLIDEEKVGSWTTRRTARELVEVLDDGDDEDEDHGGEDGEGDQEKDCGSEDDDGDEGDEEQAVAEPGDPPVTQNIGSDSEGEIARKLARLDELEREAGLWTIQRNGYESEIAELKAKLGREEAIPYQRRLFKRALRSVQKTEVPDIDAKEKRSLFTSATTDLVELIRSAVRDDLGLDRFDLVCFAPAEKKQ